MLEKGQNCPRIVIFMKRLDDCGDMWEDLMKVCCFVTFKINVNS